MKTGFDPDFEDLPKILPIFPLPELLLLPKGRVSLRIFEPRYIAMLDDAFKAGHRMIVLAQPKDDNFAETKDNELEGEPESDGETPVTIWTKKMQKLQKENPLNPEIYQVGCAGRIISFHENLQQQYQIELKGIYRCRLTKELSAKTLYRQFAVDFTDYRDDSEVASIDAQHRKVLIKAVRKYFSNQKIDFDLKLLDGLHDEVLITSLSMVCQFSSAEKQGLLEAKTLQKRSEFLLDLLTMNVNSTNEMGLQ